jgi:pSer/pThr/pTyr-binding forkhead associated (FHA) protein
VEDEPKPIERVNGLAAPSGSPPPPEGIASRIVITSGPKEGLEIELLPEEQFTIGRSGDSRLVLRDDVTSTHHARLMLWNDQWMIQDLDSTNGTFVDSKRVSIPTPVPLNTPITIGTTTFELRR